MKYLLNEVKNNNFNDMNKEEKKAFILNIVNENLEEKYKELFNENSNLSKLEIINKIYKEDKEFIKSLNIAMIKVMSVMQERKIDLSFKKLNSTYTAKTDDGWEYEGKYKRIMATPIFNFKIDGSVTSIQFIQNYKEDILLYYLIRVFEEKFLKELSFKRTLRITF